jgi:hypothetical protein
MTKLQTCPKCGARMKFSRVHQVASSTSKRRDCPKCGHADTVLVQEIYRIIEVAKRAKKFPSQFRMRKPRRPQATKSRDNRK